LIDSQFPNGNHGHANPASIPSEKNMKRLFAICLFCTVASAHAAQADLSRASTQIGAASAIVVLGSLSTLAASGLVVVASVETLGDGALLVLQGAADAGKVSIRLGAQAARDLSLAAGTVVSVVAVSTGHALMLAGKVIAYIPNEVGAALLHHSAVH
jgi:hypothetical protein